MKSLGIDTQVVGYSTLVNAQTIELAGEAINGVLGVSTWSTEYDPLENFVEKFKLRYGEEPTHDAIKGYVGFYTVKAAIEAVGEFDREKVKNFLHENPITTEMEPNVFMDLRYRSDGTIDRELFLIEVEDEKQKLVKLIPPEKPEAF
jgi:branched-chain amino acid transport system substrate-binding protein